jgi:hypothetical protein
VSCPDGPDCIARIAAQLPNARQDIADDEPITDAEGTELDKIRGDQSNQDATS